MRVHSIHLLTCALAAASFANAAVIHDNGAPDQVTGNNMSEYIQVDDFTVATPSTLLSIRFWALQSADTDYAGSIEWYLYADNSGIPGAQFANGIANAVQTATGLGNAGLGLLEFRYDFTISQSVNPGTYWLGLHNGLLNNLSGDMYWESSATGGGNSAGEFDLVFLTPFNQNQVEKAFIVFGDDTRGGNIPEPGSVLLISIGLGGLAVLRRRR